MIMPSMAQEECVTIELALERVQAIDDTVTKLDTLVVPELGTILFLQSPTQETLLAVYFDVNGCWTGELMEVTKEQYTEATGKAFVNV